MRLKFERGSFARLATRAHRILSTVTKYIPAPVRRGSAEDPSIQVADVKLSHIVRTPLGSVDGIRGNHMVPHDIGVYSAEEDKPG